MPYELHSVDKLAKNLKGTAGAAIPLKDDKVIAAALFGASVCRIGMRNTILPAAWVVGTGV